MSRRLPVQARSIVSLEVSRAIPLFFVKIDRIDTKYTIVATMTAITKESIKDTLLRIYQETGESPKRSTKIPEFSAGTVANKFGSWGNALAESGIPLRVQPPQQVNCGTCNVMFMKQVSNIKKYPNHFCSRSCSATHRNTNRIVSEATRAKTSASHKAKPTKDHSKLCLECGITFKHVYRKTCSDECYSNCRSKNSKVNGAIGGRESQASQPRRSKGEVLFFTLCSNYFGEDEVLSNAQVFIDKNGNFWDSDIVIPKCRLALCYNGIWHYQQIGKKHNLKQVQSRDLIKKSIISENGYIQYIIKDMGKFNEEFVYEQFHQFIFRFLIHLELKMK